MCWRLLVAGNVTAFGDMSEKELHRIKLFIAE